MENRRTFLKKCAAGWLTISLPAWPACAKQTIVERPMKTNRPKTAAVIWYSQTGHTQRIGNILNHQWRRAGITVDAADYRDYDTAGLGAYDLIVFGSPVHYMDVPVNLRQWLKQIPRIDGTPVGSYVTFGGSGDGQQYTAAALLSLAAEKGGVPAGMDMFSNMSTFAPTWSLGNGGRILAYRDLPSPKTFERARLFADKLLERILSGKSVLPKSSFGMDSVMRLLPQIGLSKRLVSNHRVDKNKCVDCGICVEKCPTGAIDPDTGRVDTDRCILCLGCINNCPVQAVEMNFMGKPVYGFPVFLEKNGIVIREPAV